MVTTPFGTETLLVIAMVTPEQSAPKIAATPSAVTRRSAAAVAAAASMQVESPLTGTSTLPPRKASESDASFRASSAESAMAGVSDSIGPVKPRMTPTLTSWPSALASGARPRHSAAAAATNATHRVLLMIRSSFHQGWSRAPDHSSGAPGRLSNHNAVRPAIRRDWVAALAYTGMRCRRAR